MSAYTKWLNLKRPWSLPDITSFSRMHKIEVTGASNLASLFLHQGCFCIALTYTQAKQHKQYYLLNPFTSNVVVGWDWTSVIWTQSLYFIQSWYQGAQLKTYIRSVWLLKFHNNLCSYSLSCIIPIILKLYCQEGGQ